MKKTIKNPTRAWYENGSIQVSFNQDLTKEQYNRFIDPEKVDLNDIVDVYNKDDCIPFDYLKEDVQDEIIDQIIYSEDYIAPDPDQKLTHEQLNGEIEDLKYAFAVDVTVQDKNCEHDRKGSFAELSDEAKEIVIRSIVAGKESSQIWANQLLESEQSLDEKLNIAGNAVSCAEKTAEKDIER